MILIGVSLGSMQADFVSANRQTTFTGGFFVPVFLVRARQPFVKRSQERR